MKKDRKKRLIELGPEALANALLELATRDDTADDLIERLIATPQKHIQRFKEKLAGLKRRQRFIPWNESAAFAYKLQIILEDLKSGVDDPRTGVELIATFFQADSYVFEQCDDSDGNIGDVFVFDAKERFVEYASKCKDKQWVSDLVFDLNRNNSYGVRDILVDCAADYLPKSIIQNLIKKFQTAAGNETVEYKKRDCLMSVESLAKQIKDAPLFEKTRIASWGKLNTAAFLDIARVYLDSGETETALAWLQRVPAEGHFQMADRDQLLLEIYGKMGNTSKQAEAARRIFRRRRSKNALADLLKIIGHDQKDTVIQNEVTDILKSASLSHSDALFLVETGHLDAAETYIFQRSDQLNGDFYSGLIPLAESMATAGRRLCTSIILRALLDSILRRGQTKTYAHGVRYLKQLDRIAEFISDWHEFQTHASYMENLRDKHGRKRSFWSQYEK